MAPSSIVGSNMACGAKAQLVTIDIAHGALILAMIGAAGTAILYTNIYYI